MAKKTTRSKKSRASSRKTKPAKKKASSRKATSRKTGGRKTAARKSASRRAASKPKTAGRRSSARKKASSRAKPKVRASGGARRAARPLPPRRGTTLGPRGRVADLDDARGLGPESGGQSGDIEGLPRAEVADSESVEELAEEGQAFEAELVDAVENAPEGEIHTREVPEDDVPQEYLDED
jgi:hypothetical protein